MKIISLSLLLLASCASKSFDRGYSTANQECVESRKIINARLVSLNEELQEKNRRLAEIGQLNTKKTYSGRFSGSEEPKGSEGWMK